MRSRVQSSFLRAAFAASMSALLLVGPTGCGESAPENTPRSELPESVKKANTDMENFVKQKAAEKK